MKAARLYKGDVERLNRIADAIDEEALSWQQGFAASYGDGKYVWDKEYPNEHARYIRLKSASEFIRGLAQRAQNGEEKELSNETI